MDKFEGFFSGPKNQLVFHWEADASYVSFRCVPPIQLQSIRAHWFSSSGFEFDSCPSEIGWG